MNRRPIAAVSMAIALSGLFAAQPVHAADFVITNGTVTFQEGSTAISLNASNLSLNIGTRFFGFFLPCASGCAEGPRVFQTGLYHELSRGNVEYNGRSTFVSLLDSFQFNGIVTIPSTSEFEVTARGRFTFIGIFSFDDFSDPLVVRRVDARLLGSGIVSMPLRQTEPGIFASAGPQQYEFLPTLDLDADGVPDSQDECPATVLGDVVDSFGCSIAQYVPCAGPLEGTPWKNRGQFMTALMATTQMFETLGLINSRQRIEIITAAAQSTCGK